MTMRIRELLSTVSLLLFIWLSALASDYIAVRAFQMNGASGRNSGWAVIIIGAIQLIIMYAGTKTALKILRKNGTDKSTELVATLFAWLFSEKVLAFPRLLSTLLPAGLISTNSIVSTITVVAAHLVATYVLVLLISRRLLPTETTVRAR